MKSKVTKIIKAAVFAALACVCTMMVAIPLGGGGYANLGDTIVVTAGFFCGSFFGPLAAAVGSALADILSGYALYAPATFVIKGIMALIVSLICRKMNKSGFSWRVIVSAVVAEVLMVAGYFVFEVFVYNIGVAVMDILGNAIQGACGIVFSSILVNVLNANKNIRKLIKI